MTDSKQAIQAREYRKTATIMAEQYLGQHVPGVCTGGRGCQSKGAPDDSVPHIHTLEGDLTVSHGDWIATGVKGEHWAIKPDVFAASYEPVSVLSALSGGGDQGSLAPVALLEASPCPNCGGEKWVCENHPWKPWNASGCECGAGAPCMFCNHLSRTTILDAALDYLQSAMRETSWRDAEDFLPKARWSQQASMDDTELNPKAPQPVGVREAVEAFCAKYIQIQWALPRGAMKAGVPSCHAVPVEEIHALRALLTSPPTTGETATLPADLAGPYHQDEMGTFNSTGWGFTVLIPDELNGDWPDHSAVVADAAEVLECTIRLHLNALPKPPHGGGSHDVEQTSSMNGDLSVYRDVKP